MWTFKKVCIEFVTVFLLLYVLVFWPQGMWDLSSPGSKPTLPVLEGEALTTGPPRKSPVPLLLRQQQVQLSRQMK